jgi:hypothetical protein
MTNVPATLLTWMLWKQLPLALLLLLLLLDSTEIQGRSAHLDAVRAAAVGTAAASSADEQHM